MWGAKWAMTNHQHAWSEVLKFSTEKKERKENRCWGLLFLFVLVPAVLGSAQKMHENFWRAIRRNFKKTACKNVLLVEMLFWRPSGDFREMRGSSTFQNWSGSKFKEIQVSKFEIGIRHTFPIWDPWNGSKRARGNIIKSRCRRFYLPGINIASEARKAVLKIVKYQLNHFRGEIPILIRC